MVHDLANLIVNAYRTGNKILICGNGGLAAESEHFAAELMGKFGKQSYFPCIALTANSSLVTALANDFGYEQVFSHQVNVLGQPGDVLIAMTTSASKNIQMAIMAGRQKSLKTICLCGCRSPELGADFVVMAEGEDTASIQEGILAILHRLAVEVKELA